MSGLAGPRFPFSAKPELVFPRENQETIMPLFIRAFNNHNEPLVGVNNEILPRSYFNIIKLKKEGTFFSQIPGYETCWVLAEGVCDINVNGQEFNNVGRRANIWESQRADSVYAPANAEVNVVAVSDAVKIYVAGGRCDQAYKPFRILPEDVKPVEVGSVDTHSRRVINHILGAKDEGRTGNLLVSELYTDPGCWAGYPPHKHGEDIPAEKGKWKETGFEEIYHFEYNPQNGFGAQFDYYPGSMEERNVWMVRSGDTFCISGGYHPGVTSPGHAEYIFTILVGHTSHSLVQNFDPEYSHLASSLPGVKDMVALFTGQNK